MLDSLFSPDLWNCCHSCCGVFGIKASEFRYRKPLICQYPGCDCCRLWAAHEIAAVGSMGFWGQTDCLVAISQSGETADTLEAIKMAKEHKVRCLRNTTKCYHGWKDVVCLYLLLFWRKPGLGKMFIVETGRGIDDWSCERGGFQHCSWVARWSFVGVKKVEESIKFATTRSCTKDGCWHVPSRRTWDWCGFN